MPSPYSRRCPHKPAVALGPGARDAAEIRHRSHRLRITCKCNKVVRKGIARSALRYANKRAPCGTMRTYGNSDVRKTGCFPVKDNDKEELTERFMNAVDYLNRQVHTFGLDDWQGLDITIPQIKTLVLLERSGPLRMGSIARYLDRALSATTTVVDRLVERGLVDRAWDPNDRRVVICRLTDQGKQGMEQFWRIRRERLQLMVDFLDVEQLGVVVRGLEVAIAADKALFGSQESGQSTD